MSNENILKYCDDIDLLTQRIRDEVLATPPPEPPVAEWTPVAAGADLQACLDSGGAWELADACYQCDDGYRMTVPETSLRGIGGASLSGDHAPALTLPVGLKGATVETLTVEVTDCEVGLLIGRNDEQQVTAEAAPRDVRLHRVTSQSHRGKRPFEINGANVELHECEVRDSYDPEGQDSQAVWIGNAPGPVRIIGGYLEAASEVIMVGGDAMKIPNCRPTGLVVFGVTLTKPLAWRDAGTPKVKNILELKDGHDVLIEDCTLSNCWQSAQDGYAFMFTPTRGGSVRNVIVKNCHVSEVAGIMNITGVDADDRSLPRTQIWVNGGEYRTNKAAMGGSGRFCLIGRGPEYVVVEHAFIRHEGSSFIDIGDDDPVDLLSVVDCDWNYGTYGIRIGGYNHGDNTLGQVRELRIEGNTITGAHSQFRNRYPNNTYIESMTTAHELELEGRPPRWDD